MTFLIFSIAYIGTIAAVVITYEARLRAERRRQWSDGYLEGTKATILHEQRIARAKEALADAANAKVADPKDSAH